MGPSWPRAAMTGRSNSGAPTGPSPETSRIWTTPLVRFSSPPTPASCSIPGVGTEIVVMELRSCSVSTGQERVRFTKHDNTVYSGAISPDRTLAATAGGDFDEIYLWKVTDAAPLHRLAGKGKPNLSACWSPDGKLIGWGSTFKFTSYNDRGPMERSFSLADLEFGPLADAGHRRARESLGSLSLQLTGPTCLEVKQQNAVVAKIAPPHDRETIRSFSFVTGGRVAVGGDFALYLFDARTGAKIREFQGHTSTVWAVTPSPDGRFLLSASGDQTIRIWLPDRDDPLLSLFFAGDDWIAWAPEGYYAASPGGENLMGWQISNGPEQVGTFVPASQFRKSLNRPDVIKLALKTGSVASALERLNERVKVVQEVLPPLVVITSPDHTGVRVDNPELTVRAKALARPGHPSAPGVCWSTNGRTMVTRAARMSPTIRPVARRGSRAGKCGWNPAGIGWPPSPRATSARAARTRSRSSTTSSAPDAQALRPRGRRRRLRGRLAQAQVHRRRRETPRGCPPGPVRPRPSRASPPISALGGPQGHQGSIPERPPLA